MHRYTDENGLQMVLDLDDRYRLADIRAVAAILVVVAPSSVRGFMPPM